jgi:hypothetical protein
MTHQKQKYACLLRGIIWEASIHTAGINQADSGDKRGAGVESTEIISLNTLNVFYPINSLEKSFAVRHAGFLRSDTEPHVSGLIAFVLVPKHHPNTRVSLEVTLNSMSLG